MARVAPFDRRATYDDLTRLPDELVAEIVGGELHANPRPLPGVSGSVMALGGMLLRRLGRGEAEGWQILPTPELHLGGDVLVPGLAGWRTSRLPELPSTPFFPVAPEWVCETLSSSTASLRARKMAVYAAHGVSHLWLIDPVAHTLEVRRVEDDRWTTLATHVGDLIVHAEPFETVELPLAALWPREPDRRRV